jgi:hypothetical protein
LTFMAVQLYSTSILLIYLRYRTRKLKINISRCDTQGHCRVASVHCLRYTSLVPAWAKELGLNLFKSVTARDTPRVDGGIALLRVERNPQTVLVF